MRILRTLLVLAGGITLGASGLLVADQYLSQSKPSPTQHRFENFDRFPNVWLTTHDGQKVRFYDDLLKDKIVAINFFYSTCTEF
jgi:protein SCO1/2